MLDKRIDAHHALDVPGRDPGIYATELHWACLKGAAMFMCLAL